MDPKLKEIKFFSKILKFCVNFNLFSSHPHIFLQVIFLENKSLGMLKRLTRDLKLCVGNPGIWPIFNLIAPV